METETTIATLSEPTKIDLTTSDINELCARYLESKSKVRTLNQDVKEAKENNEDFGKLVELNEQVRALRLKIKDNPDLVSLLDRLETAKDELKIRGEVVQAKLQYMQLNFFEYDGIYGYGDFRVVGTLKYKRKKR